MRCFAATMQILSADAQEEQPTFLPGARSFDDWDRALYDILWHNSGTVAVLGLSLSCL